MKQYPIQDSSLIDTARSNGTAFPISNNLFWHNGIHIGVNGNAPIQCVYEGTIAAMRVDKDYQNIDIGNSFSEAALQYYAGDGWAELQGKLETYFDISGDTEKTYKIKSGMSDQDTYEAKRLLQCLFSTSFVMVHHTARTMYGTDIKFYSLYMHLKPMKYLSFTKLMGLSWYRLSIQASGACYYGIQSYTDEACETPGIVVPGETIVVADGKKITWVLNDKQETGFVKDIASYREINGHYEMKRPTELEQDDGKKYYPSDKFVKKEGMLLYSSDNVSSRTVTGIIGGNECVMVNDASEFIQRAGALYVTQLDGSKVKQKGWVYLSFPFPVSKAYPGITFAVNTENGAIDAYVQGGNMESSCVAYGLKFSCALRDGLSYDSVCTPKDISIDSGMHVGYPGLFAGNTDLCHFEVFASDVAFLEKDKDKEVPSAYITRSECSAYYGKPHTIEQKAAMPSYMQPLSTHYVLKLKNGGKPVCVVTGDNYYEIEYIAKKVHAFRWIKREDLPDHNTIWYYNPKGGEKTVNVYLTKEQFFPQEIVLYPKLGYKYEDEWKYKTKKDKGKEKIVEMRKIREFYEKVNNIPPLLISERVCNACTTKRETIPDVLDITMEIESGSFLAEITAEQPERHGVYKIGTSFTSEGNEVSLYPSRNSTSPMSRWVQVSLDGPERQIRFINKSTVYLRKKEKAASIERIPYNDWLYFFEKRDSVGKGAKIKNFSELVKENDTVLNKLDAESKANASGFGAFVNTDIECFEYLSNLVYKRASEWKKDDALTKEIHEDNAVKKVKVEAIRNVACFWDEAKSAAASNLDAVFPKSEVNWYFHPLRFLDHLSKVSIDEVENLKKVQDRVLKLNCLKMGKGGLPRFNCKVTSKQTYCNHAVYLTLMATDASYKTAFLQNRELQCANDFFDILMQQAANKVLQERDAESAQQLANHGFTVVGAWKNPDPKKSGHVVTVSPTTNTYDSNSGPRVLQIGEKNKYSTAWSAFALNVKTSNEIHWFWNQNQQFQFDVGEIQLNE